MNVSWRWVFQICLMCWGLVYILKDLWRGQKDESIRDDLVSSYQTCPVPTRSSLNTTSQRGSSSLIIISEYLWGLPMAVVTQLASLCWFINLQHIWCRQAFVSDVFIWKESGLWTWVDKFMFLQSPKACFWQASFKVP